MPHWMLRGSASCPVPPRSCDLDAANSQLTAQERQQFHAQGGVLNLGEGFGIEAGWVAEGRGPELERDPREYRELDVAW
jgi:hypothetical protein